ncbi:hypothetical protein DH2020_013231 [Rehmannia glutinosa]|uniref:LOB domain-containing protein n=1 Tax=Rehmannia glutinosa TaxID=99300 RepID=A0ABR0X1R6_REHGL
MAAVAAAVIAAAAAPIFTPPQLSLLFDFSKRSNSSDNLIPQHHHRTHGSTTQACAACKYQRRKCAADCILAPYFPHDRQRQFLNAHRLFGVSNIVKIVRHLDPPAKDHAMRTIIFQSDARAADPVGGCYRIIRDLEQQISLAKAELDIVLHHLALCRAARHQQVVAPMGGAAEDEVVVIDDVNSWSCMHGNNVNTHAESTSSSFPHNHNNNNEHMGSLSLEDCNHDQMKSILDQLSGDHDDTHEDYKFDSHGNILTSNNGILTEENVTFKEDDGPFSYIQDQHDLKAAATFFTLTNCALVRKCAFAHTRTRQTKVFVRAVRADMHCPAPDSGRSHSGARPRRAPTSPVGKK